jgi:hypothetical protein
MKVVQDRIHLSLMVPPTDIQNRALTASQVIESCNAFLEDLKDRHVIVGARISNVRYVTGYRILKRGRILLDTETLDKVRDTEFFVHRLAAPHRPLRLVRKIASAQIGKVMFVQTITLR